jgi:hypothetical protein
VNGYSPENARRGRFAPAKRDRRYRGLPSWRFQDAKRRYEAQRDEKDPRLLVSAGS